MKEETLQLSQEIVSLKAMAIKQTCNNCFIMQQYSTQKYYKLFSKSEAIENLYKSNFMQHQAHSIKDLKRSISMIGMYILV